MAGFLGIAVEKRAISPFYSLKRRERRLRAVPTGIPDTGIQRIAARLTGWKEDEKLSRYIHASDAETNRLISEIVERLNVLEADARETDNALRVILEELNKRQRSILEVTIIEGSITNRHVQEQFKVVRDTVHRDLTVLCALGPLQKQGKGRATHYVPVIRDA